MVTTLYLFTTAIGSMEIDSSKDISILSVSMVGGNGAGGDGSFNHYHANGSGGNGINITRSENINMDSCSISGGHAVFLLTRALEARC